MYRRFNVSKARRSPTVGTLCAMFSVDSTMTSDKKKILGPVLIPDKKMLRYDEDDGFYDLVFTADTISKIKTKFDREHFGSSPTLKHGHEFAKGTFLTDSFLLSDENRNELPIEFQELPNGTWMLEYTFEDESTYSRMETEGLFGFSGEITFNLVDESGVTKTVTENLRLMNSLSDLLPFNVHVFGGSTDGAGRNEHGDAHFELKAKGSGKSLGKILMPSLQTWKNSDFSQRMNSLKILSGNDISTKDKKAMVRWLELNENENLLKCHRQWNESNKYNNRTTQI